jgi:hypothetical protein
VTNQVTTEVEKGVKPKSTCREIETSLQIRPEKDGTFYIDGTRLNLLPLFSPMNPALI